MVGVSPKRRSRGQGNTEYVVIVALVAIATIGVVSLFGDNIRSLFGASSDTLAGDEVGNPGKHSAPAMTDKNLSNFAEQSAAYNPNGMPMMKSQSAGGSSFGANGAGAGSAK